MVYCIVCGCPAFDLSDWICNRLNPEDEYYFEFSKDDAK
jgi:hypothetical protein